MGIASEIGARHTVASMDPTANLAMVEFLLRVPDDRFCRTGRSSLLRQAFQTRLPEAVLTSYRKGLQSADIGHRVLRELSQFDACLNSLESSPEAQGTLNGGSGGISSKAKWIVGGVAIAGAAAGAAIAASNQNSSSASH